MTISPFLIYLWGIVDNIIVAACVLSFLTGVAALMSGMGCTMLTESYEKDARAVAQAVFKPALRACIAFILLATFIPDKKTIACMVVVPAIANSKVIQQDVPELYNMAVDALKESLTPAKK